MHELSLQFTHGSERNQEIDLKCFFCDNQLTIHISISKKPDEKKKRHLALTQPDLSRNAGSVETERFECLMAVGDCVCLFFSTVYEKDCRKKKQSEIRNLG